MPKYNVTIYRTYVHRKCIVVEAEDKQDARLKALDRISDEVLELQYGLPDDDDAIVNGEVR